MKKDNIQGIIYIILAGFFFSLMTMFVKLAGDLPVFQKAFFRNAVAAVAALAILGRSEDKFYIRSDSWKGLIMRSTFGVMGIICNFYAIDRLGLADSNMLNKLSPFFAIILSIFILKEKPNRVEWLSVVIAFIGAAFIIKPSMNITSLYGFIGLLGGFGAGMAYTFVRKLGKQGERGPVIVMFFSVFSSIVLLPLMIYYYEPMTVKQLIILLFAGFSALGGQLCITKAYTKAPAREISVFDYSQILFASLLGFFIFAELPDVYSIIGYVIIIGVAIFKWQYTLRKDR